MPDRIRATSHRGHSQVTDTLPQPIDADKTPNARWTYSRGIKGSRTSTVEREMSADDPSISSPTAKIVVFGNLVLFAAAAAAGASPTATMTSHCC